MVLNFRTTHIAYAIYFLLTLVVYTCGMQCKSLIGLETLLDTHNSVIETLSEYLNSEKKRIKLLKGYLKTLKVQKKRRESDSSFLKNPINVLAFVKQLSQDYTSMTMRQRKTGYHKNESLAYPGYKELSCAVDTVTHLQTFYRLNITDLARGRLVGHYSENRQHFFEEFTPLTTDDCYVIASILMNRKNNEIALQWYMEALDLFSYSNKDHKIYDFNVHDIVDRVSECYDDIDMKRKWANMIHNDKAIKWLNINKKSVLARFRDHSSKQETNRTLEDIKMIKKNAQVPLGYKWIDLVPKRALYQSLCREKQEPPPHISKKLTCSYLHNHPYLRLGPIKTEQLYLQPDVLLYYEVISDAEIPPVIYAARTYRNGSSGVLGGVVTLRYTSNKPRASETSWLVDSITPELQKVSYRVQLVTGLSLRGAEPFQVVEYGPGGHYGPHHDSPASFPVPQDNRNAHGRISTMIFYLSEPTQGGATVFTELGLTVYPKKGSALVWYNIHPSGRWVETTVHAGCPVLRGKKWVANKWPAFSGQDSIQCPLKSDVPSIFTKFYNLVQSIANTIGYRCLSSKQIQDFSSFLKPLSAGNMPVDVSSLAVLRNIFQAIHEHEPEQRCSILAHYKYLLDKAEQDLATMS